MPIETLDTTGFFFEEVGFKAARLAANPRAVGRAALDAIDQDSQLGKRMGRRLEAAA